MSLYLRIVSRIEISMLLNNFQQETAKEFFLFSRSCLWQVCGSTKSEHSMIFCNYYEFRHAVKMLRNVNIKVKMMDWSWTGLKQPCT